MADGSIIFSTNLDNKELEKKLTKIKKEIEKQEQAISTQEGKKSPLVQQAQELEQRMKAARTEVIKYRADWATGVSGADKKQSAAIEKTQQLETEHAKVVAQIDKLDAKLQPAYTKLDGMKEKAGGIEKELAAAASAANPLAPAMGQAEKYMERFAMRVKALARRVFVFTVITMALRSIRAWMGKAIKKNSEAVSAIARLKGALLTLAQPLVDIIIPAFTALVSVLADVISAISSLMAGIFGTTQKSAAESAESMYSETEAIEGVGAAAKKSGKQLAAFDEINKLSNDDSGGGGSSGSEIAPNFSYAKEYGDRLKDIAEAVMLIGFGLALWKISSILPGQLGAVAKTVAGIAIAVGGLIILWSGLKDAWENGIDWGNLTKMLIGAAIAVGGLYLAFGKLGAAIGLIVTGLSVFTVGIKDAFENGVNWQNLIAILSGAAAAAVGLYLAFGKIGAGIGLVLLGITMLITGFKDVMENGVNLQNTLLIVAGIVATGLGISLLTGSLLPALVSGIAAVIYAFVAWQGNAEELATNLKLILTGIIDFLTGVFTGDWEKAWTGLKDVFRGIINSVIIIFESVINGVITGLNFLISKINTLHWDIPEWVPGIGGESFGFSINPFQKVTLPRVPALATGAVIPPNREFMAILGDQKSGMNVEAPESLLRQMANDAAGMNTGLLQKILDAILAGKVMVVDSTAFAKVVYAANKSESHRHGTSLVVR
ncbi:MAG: hypothetical protein ACLSE7_07105 [Lachnospirales bacterium]